MLQLVEFDDVGQLAPLTVFRRSFWTVYSLDTSLPLWLCESLTKTRGRDGNDQMDFGRRVRAGRYRCERLIRTELRHGV
jgi:hypothetical protein